MFSISIDFSSLPFWQGVQSEPGIQETLPFSLKWHPAGYFAQFQAYEIEQKIQQIYSTEKYIHGTLPPGNSDWSISRGLHQIDFIKRVLGDLNQKNVLEIGGGSLFVAEQLCNEFEIDNYFVIDPTLKEKPQSESIHVIPNYFSQDLQFEIDFDVILSFSCLEHIPEPIPFIESLHHLASEKNRNSVIIGFPQFDSGLQVGDLNTLCHEHFGYFTESTSRNLFKRQGFKIHNCEVDSHGIFFHLETREKKPFEIQDESNKLLHMANKIQSNNTHINTKILNELDQGNKIAFHGATNGLNTLLYLNKIQEHPNLEIFDGDASKAGKFLPAFNKSIKDAKSTDYKTFSKVYIAALGFYPQIKKFLKEYHNFAEQNIARLIPDVD